ncbi:hypothetical protein VI06_21060 [Aquitalea magnusonii]|nr:hypothetical protein VI06_21060 [Aquitalea magnusonii]
MLLSCIAMPLWAVTSSLPLTDRQQHWLQSHAQQNIKFCFNANWPPYESQTAGSPQGIFQDYLAIFSQRTGLKFTPYNTPDWTAALAAVQRGDCAFLVGAVATKERETFLNFTPPYFTMYHVLVAKPDKPFIGSLESLNGKRLVGPQNGAIMKWLRQDYPGILQLQVVTGDEILNAILTDRAYAAVAPLDSFVAAYNWQIHNLKIIGKVDYPYPISVAVRKDQPQLFEMMKLAVASLDENDHANILRKYQKFTLVEQVDYRKLTGIVLAALLVISYLYYVNRRLSREVFRRERAEQELVHLAHYDALTGLPTLRMAMAVLESAISRGQRNGKLVGLLFIDLDGFKSVNDNWGHQTGDALLKVVASTIQASIRGSDLAARIGGDEFIVLLEGANKLEELSEVGYKILRALSGTFSINNLQVQVSASIGLAVSPLHSTDANSLIKLADQAMYQAKHNGKNNLVTAQGGAD